MIVKLHFNASLKPNFSFSTYLPLHQLLTVMLLAALNIACISLPARADNIEARPSVLGVLRDHKQLPVADADIFIKSSAGNASVFSKTDQDGRFQAFDLPLGNITVVARDPMTQALSMVQAQLQRPEQQLPMDLQVARTDARIEGIVSMAGKPVADASITLLSKQVFADVGVAQRVTKTDANGHFKIEKVMLGTMRILAEADGMLSQQDIDTASGNTQHVQIALGNSAHLPNVLTGEDGSSFELDWTLALVNGSGLSQPAYQNAYSLQINGWNLPGIPAATKLNGGRELRLEAVTVEGIDVSRQIFMPGAGAYVRYLDVLRNTGQTEASVQVDVLGLLGTTERTTLLQSPEQTEQRFAITGGAGLRLGHVFSGNNPPVPGNFQFDTSGNVRYNWKLTIPAGASVALMHFALQRSPKFDAEAMHANALALAELRLPEMLQGLSPQDKAAIRNFTIRP
jgi:hypothetical protein